MQTNIALSIITLAAAMTGAVYGILIDRSIEQKKAEVAEAVRPAQIAIVKITAPQCIACFDVEKVLETVKQERVTITDERSVTAESDEGKALITEHNIRRIPTYVATGELVDEKFGAYMKQNGERHGDAFVFTNLPFAYVDLSENKERGAVDATVITDPVRCVSCTDPLTLVDRLKEGGGVAIREEKALRAGTKEANALLAKYNIKKMPALILTGDVAVYSLFTNTPIGSIEKDGAFVVRDVPMPYLDLVRGRMITGAVSLVMLGDVSCTECYDVRGHKQILGQFGVRIASERTVDIASREGKTLLRTYGVTKVPTILLSPEISAYETLKGIWKEVGKVAPNGWYVFTEFEQLGPVVYKDLKKNEIIKPDSKEKK